MKDYQIQAIKRVKAYKGKFLIWNKDFENYFPISKKLVIENLKMVFVEIEFDNGNNALIG